MQDDVFRANQEKLAIKLRQLRIKENISQEKLAYLAKVDRTLISKIERSIANPSLEVLVKISECLNVSVDHLLKL